MAPGGPGEELPDLGRPRSRWPLALALLLLVALLVWRRGELAASWSQLRGLPPSTLLAALGCVVLSWVLRWAKFELYLRRLGVSLAAPESFRIFLAGMSMAVTPGKLGEVVKSFLIRRSAGVPVTRTACIVVLERVTDVVGMLGLLALASSGGDGPGWIEGLSLLGVLGLLLAFAFPRPWFWLLDHPVLPLPGRLRTGLRQALAAGGELSTPGLVLGTGLLSVPAWGLEAAALHLFLGSLGADPSLGLSLRVYALGTLAGALSFLPGGLGAAEGGMLLLLQQGGVGRAAALSATVLLRLSTLWFGVGAGTLALGARGSLSPEE